MENTPSYSRLLVRAKDLENAVDQGRFDKNPLDKPRVPEPAEKVDIGIIPADLYK